jgi:hypothetical protein
MSTIIERQPGKDFYTLSVNGKRKDFPGIQSKSDFYEAVRKELGLPETASNKEIKRTLLGMTWNGQEWVKDPD